MSNIIERLRWHSEDQATGKLRLTNPDGPEAAAEIERLRAEIARLREAMEEYVNTVVKMEGVTFVEYMENAELRAVIESVLAEKEK